MEGLLEGGDEKRVDACGRKGGVAGKLVADVSSPYGTEMGASGPVSLASNYLKRRPSGAETMWFTMIGSDICCAVRLA